MDTENPVIIGISGGLSRVMDRVAAVRHAPVPVLLLGESGTGKEVIARAIHNGSARRSGPFVRVNCGAISPELIDSELFGHERGAFTGAIAQKRGWFERAHGGTLLLDEIGDLPLAAQVRLLRVLQDGAFERVGGEEEIHVDVRIVAATHRDLPAMVQDGRFREDLWYRISGYPIVIPPVRERPQDMGELARHLCEKAAQRFGLIAPELREEDIDVLRAYSWPGNVRELASVIDRAVLLCDGARIDFHSALERSVFIPLSSDQDARQEGRRPAPPGAAPAMAAPPGSAPLEGFAPRDLRLNHVIAEHIRHILHVTSGVIEGPAGAAQVLDINPHTLRARMRKLGIRWTDYRRGAGRERAGQPRQNKQNQNSQGGSDT